MKNLTRFKQVWGVHSLQEFSKESLLSGLPYLFGSGFFIYAIHLFYRGFPHSYYPFANHGAKNNSRSVIEIALNNASNVRQPDDCATEVTKVRKTRNEKAYLPEIGSAQ